MARLLTIHAHPDDEASKGAPTCGRYVSEGHEAVLVCATGGEEGDIQNPAMDRPEIKENMAAVRADELAASVEAIGFSDCIMLGYRDSGMEADPANANPECFWQADLDEATERFVAIIRRVRPHILMTYGDDQQGYRHPDHLRVHDISYLAWQRAGDPAWYPEAGEPWVPQKLYYSTWSRARLAAHHAKFQELGKDSPYNDRWFERPDQDHRINAKVDVTGFYGVRRAALLAHATQVDPNEKFWFGLDDADAEAAYPYEDFILAESRVGRVPAGGEDLEHDLFHDVVEAGLEPVAEDPAASARAIATVQTDHQNAADKAAEAAARAAELAEAARASAERMSDAAATAAARASDNTVETAAGDAA